MHFRYLFSILGSLLMLIASLLAAFGLLAYTLYPDEDEGIYFFISAAISLAMGFLMRLRGKFSITTGLTYRESFAVASLGWMLVALVGALPFYISGQIPSFTDAYFESVSGFTTTGASILNNIESLGHTMLLWRSFTQWLGGMGIIVLTLAIIPTLGSGGMNLFIAEVSGPTPDKIVPRVADTAKSLYLTYLMFTFAQVTLLFLGGMNLFEAFCHTFSTLSSGGFSPLNSSIGSYYTQHYSSNYLYYEIVIVIFMFLSGINFNLHYKMLTGDFRAYFKSHEFFHYTGIIFSIILLVSVNLYTENIYSSFWEALRHSVFTCVSLVTGTGFATEDYALWPSTCKITFIICVFFGGMAGSTTGGVKIIRIAAILKEAIAGIKHTIHPKRIFSIQFGKEYLDRETIAAINAFMILYVIIYVFGVFAMSYTGYDLETIASMSIATLGNIGPGLGMIGPTQNFSNLPDYVKWICCLYMFLGRLELLPVLVLFLPRIWTK